MGLVAEKVLEKVLPAHKFPHAVGDHPVFYGVFFAGFDVSDELFEVLSVFLFLVCVFFPGFLDRVIENARFPAGENLDAPLGDNDLVDPMHFHRVLRIVESEDGVAVGLEFGRIFDKLQTDLFGCEPMFEGILRGTCLAGRGTGAWFVIGVWRALYRKT